MGDGCTDVKGLMNLVTSLGFDGYNEVEVFSEEYWGWDQHQYMDLILERYQALL